MFSESKVPPAELKKAQFMVSAARTKLLTRSPFFGTIALNFHVEFSDDIPTAAVSGQHKVIVFNPKFVIGLNQQQVIFLVAHECMHPMLLHHVRMGSRDPQKWNIAGDFVINQMLSDEKVGDFIEGGCLDRQLVDAGGWSSEGVYSLLPENQASGGKNGASGIGNDILPNSSMSPADEEMAAGEAKTVLAQAAQVARQAGKLSVQLERFVNVALNPQVPWEEVLIHFFVRAKTDTRSYAKPARRWLSQGLYMPSKAGFALGNIVVAVDCSGSVSDDDLSKFGAEIMAIHSDLRPRKLSVIYFDHGILRVDEFGPDDTPTFSRYGGGGTAFSPIFSRIDADEMDPVACVVLTDLCCSDFGPMPDYPVLWVSNYSDQAPWGQVIKIK